MVFGSQIVLIIAPAATAFALMVGITLGLPAGYYGGRIDSVLSFLANLVLAFPVILLFYLLVTPGIMDTPIPYGLAGLFFLFPIIFFATLFCTRFKNRPDRLYLLLGADARHRRLGLCRPGLRRRSARHRPHRPEPAQHLRRGGLRLAARACSASCAAWSWTSRRATTWRRRRPAARRPWYIMLWEILPNARGPLIVDACLRIGYTTILLGTLGYFGLGLAPESPDWGTAIKDASRLLRSFIHPALPPTIALMSLRARPQPSRRRAARTIDERLTGRSRRAAGVAMNEAVKATNITDAEPILEIENLSISFFTRRGEIPAVMDFSCTVMPGEAMGIVGESGCGKSTVSLGIMRDLVQRRQNRRRPHQVQGQGHGRPVRGGAALDPRQRDRHDLPGADGQPQPGDEGRPAADGSADHARQGVEGGGLQARAGDGARGAAARPRAHDALLSAPAFRRPAAAHRHRHGAAVEAGAAAARRADHRARRDGRGRHRRTGEGARQGVRHVDDLRVAQSRPDPRDLRPHHASCIPARRSRPATIKDVFDRMRHPYTQGLFRSIPLPGADKNSRPLVAIPGQLAAAARAAEGLQFRAALPPFRRRRSATPPRSR